MFVILATAFAAAAAVLAMTLTGLAYYGAVKLVERYL